MIPNLDKETRDKYKDLIEFLNYVRVVKPYRYCINGNYHHFKNINHYYYICANNPLYIKANVIRFCQFLSLLEFTKKEFSSEDNYRNKVYLTTKGHNLLKYLKTITLSEKTVEKYNDMLRSF